MNDFINKLQKQKTAYGNAGLVRTQAESLKQLSAGIYTEEERFIYELLQNAVDAYIDTNNDILDIRIEIRDNMLCFMHNGASFTEKDIEGLCDVGKSPKANDNNALNKKKVGYKGIGFKSVFMQSVDYVCVKSGIYCFKFDKAECAKIMPNFDGEILEPDDIPWQIIPIECESPSLFYTDNYNVVTYIHSTSNTSLVSKITALLKNPQFLLFLNVGNIHISLIYNGELLVSAGRQSHGDEIQLLCNDSVVSRWLVHTSDPIPVDNSVREQLIKDFNTPQKLKKATHFELSFAISLNLKGEIEAIKDSVVYTFLPTSYKNLGTPFLVNANFITDAGRQQLHQTSEWNRLIFKSIPEKFLMWIATLSTQYKEYYKVLPDRSPKSHDELTDIYANSLLLAIRKIPFIPRLLDGRVIKASEAIIDKISFASAIGGTSMVNYINKTYHLNYTTDAFIPNIATSLMKSYGVFIWDKDALLKYISNENLFQEIDIKGDLKLINYLYEYTHNINNDSTELNKLLPVANIIYDDNNELNKAVNLFFPAVDNEMSGEDENLSFINAELYNNLSNDIIFWLGEDGLGIKELNKSSIVDYILSHPENITTENAIEIGRFLFSSWQKENFLDNSSKVNSIIELPFLSKKGNIIPIGNLYLSSRYFPEDDLESVFDEIEYISTDYVEDSRWEDWGFFFKKCGIRSKIGITSTIITADSSQGMDYKNRYDFLESAANSFRNKKHAYTNYCGYKNPVVDIKFSLSYFSYISTEQHNIDLYKLVFSKILSQPYNSFAISDRINGKVSYWGTKIDDSLVNYVPNSFSAKYNSFLEYILANEQLFPTMNGNLELACNTFLNTPSIIKYGGEYLPIININTCIDESWLKILPFKKELMLEDYLFILESIANVPTSENKEKISSIYKRLVELGYQKNKKIREWGKTHKLLSVSGNLFLLPNDLSYITVDGFKNESQVYVGKIEHSLWPGVIDLLESFGVKVITKDKISPEFEDKRDSNEMKDLLLEKLDAITLLKGRIKDKESFESERNLIKNRILNSEFYHCKKIQLSYGNEEDVIIKTTYAMNNQFYYIGSLKPTKIEPLIAPLSKHLELKNASEELLIILITSNYEDLREYLKDKGYPIEYLGIATKKVSPKDYKWEESSSVVSEGNKILQNEDPQNDTIELDKIQNNRNEDKEKNFEEYLQKYLENIIDFMGGDFTMPTDRIKSEHVITRYRALMYIKGLGEKFTIKPGFDEKAYICNDGYVPIPLADGKHINIQGAKYGIWYLSPIIWTDIINDGNYACLCTGNGEYDFMMIENENGIKNIAEQTKNVFIRLTPTKNMDIMNTIKSVFETEKIMLNDNIIFETIYTDRDVHLMLMVHQTKEPVLNSMFNNVFKETEENIFNLSDY